MRKNYLIYGGFTIISSGIGFIIVPLLSHYFSKEGFGVIGLFMIAMQLFTPIVGLSMNSIISRSYHLRDDLEELLGSALILITFITSILAVFLSVIPSYFYNYLSLDFELVMLALVAAFFMIISATFLALLQMEGKSVQWGLTTLLNTIISVVFTFLLIIMFQFDHLARLIGITLGQILAAFISCLFVCQTVKIKFSNSSEHYKYFLNLGVPLILSALSGWALISLDRVFIESMLGLEQTGVYVFSVTLASPVLIIITTFIRVWSPFAFKELAAKNNVSLLQRLVIAFISFAVVGLIFSLISPFIYKMIISEGFIPALILLPWLIAGLVFQGLQSLLIPFIMHLGDTRIIAVSALLGVFINIVCNYALIPMFGLIGACVASIASSFFMSLVYLFYVNNKYGFSDFIIRFIKDSKVNV